MPILRVYNPHRPRRKPQASVRKRRRVVACHANARRRNPGAGVLELMSNPNPKHRVRRRRRKANASPRHRRFYAKNPAHRVRRRRRNPSLGGRTLKFALYGSVGAVGTRAITQAVLADKNVSYMGYIGNAVVAYILGFAGEKAISADAGEGLLVGGLIGLVLRVAKETLFASGPLAAQLSMSGLGDADFALGAYVTDPFLLPTISTGADQMTNVIPSGLLPAIPAAAGKAAMSGYDSGFAGGRGVVAPDRWRTTWG